MAEIAPKRPREEPQAPDFEAGNPNTKRQKPYNSLLSLLEEEEDEAEPPTEDLSAMFTTLQHELSSSTSYGGDESFNDFDFIPFPAVDELDAHHRKRSDIYISAACSPISGEGEDDGAKSVIQHLLEASDDELGIPNREDNDNELVEMKSGENFPFASLSDHGLWELEDEAANYYTVLQSELFM